MTSTRAPVPAARSAASETAFAAVSDPSVATSMESIIRGRREPYPPAVRGATSMGPTDAFALPPPPSPHLRRGGRPGAHRPDAAQRDRARQGPPRLPLRGLAGHGQDLDGEAAGVRAERRGRSDARLRPGCSIGAGHPGGYVARPG